MRSLFPRRPAHRAVMLVLTPLAIVATAAPDPLAAQLPLAPSPVLSLDRLGAEIDLSGYLSVRESIRRDTAAFAVNRARITVQARPIAWAAVRLQGDLSAIGRARSDTVPAFTLTDAYVQLAPPAAEGLLARLRPALVVGQFKSPFALEYLTSFSALPTADRSLPVDRLAPRRDVGALASLSAGRWATVWGAVTNGEGANATGNPDARQMAVGRITLFPLPALAASAKWAGQGSDRRWGFDVRAALPRLLLEAEWLRRSAPPDPADAGDEGDARGGYALAAVRVLPWLEPVVKWERLRASPADATSPALRDRALTLGVNLLAPDDRLRLQLDWVDRSATSVERTDELIAQLIAIF